MARLPYLQSSLRGNNPQRRMEIPEEVVKTENRSTGWAWR